MRRCHDRKKGCGGTEQTERHAQKSYDNADRLSFASPHLRTPSYIAYMTAAFGTTRIRWADKPPYSDAAPSSAITSRSVCHSPVYFIFPSTRGCRKRVRITFKVFKVSYRILPQERKTDNTDLMGICDQTGNALRRTGTPKHP